MIQFLTHDNIDKTKWDLCIQQSINSFVYGYSWYLDVLAPRWNALVLNDYEAVMPLTGNRKLFIHYLYQPFFTQQLGVFSTSTLSQKQLHAFIEAIPHKYRFVDINLNDQNEIMEGAFKVRKRKNYVLDLNHSFAHLSSQFDDHCQRNIKKSRKHHQVIKPIDPAKAVAFYQKYKALNTSNVLPSDFENLLKVILIAEQKQLLLCRGVFNENDTPISIGIFLLHKGRIIYLLGGGSDEGREKRSMFYLFDDLILQFSDQSMLLDFEGSEIPGIARFFKGFGAEKRPYFKLHINRLPWPFNWLK
jgi:hypothetical protein